MPHMHPVVDSNPHFIIDVATRTATNGDASQLVIVQGDHNSERVTFELPRRIEGHDMVLCNVIQVHFSNASNNVTLVSNGIYTVLDAHIPEGRDDLMRFSWLIDNRATKYAGTLRFTISLKCVDDSSVTYIWKANCAKPLVVSEGIDSSNE